MLQNVGIGGRLFESPSFGRGSLLNVVFTQKVTMAATKNRN